MVDEIGLKPADFAEEFRNQFCPDHRMANLSLRRHLLGSRHIVQQRGHPDHPAIRFRQLLGQPFGVGQHPERMVVVVTTGRGIQLGADLSRNRGEFRVELPGGHLPSPLGTADVGVVATTSGGTKFFVPISNAEPVWNTTNVIT